MKRRNFPGKVNKRREMALSNLLKIEGKDKEISILKERILDQDVAVQKRTKKKRGAGMR